MCHSEEVPRLESKTSYGKQSAGVVVQKMMHCDRTSAITKARIKDNLVPKVSPVPFV